MSWEENILMDEDDKINIEKQYKENKERIINDEIAYGTGFPHEHMMNYILYTWARIFKCMVTM